MTQRIKLLASDYDDTLYNHPTILEENLAAIKEFQAQGNLFGLCSGRHIDSLLEEIEKYNLNLDFVIANNGTAILDNQLNLLQLAQIDRSLALEVVDYVSQELADDVYYVGLNNGYTYGRRFFNDGSTFMPEHKTGLSEILQGNVSTMFVEVMDQQRANDVVDKGNEYFDGRVMFHNNAPFIDITQEVITKAQGVQYVADFYGLDKDDVYTIGDNLNDLTMLKEFNSFAVEIALDEVKETANTVVKNVAQAIEFILKER